MVKAREVMESTMKVVDIVAMEDILGYKFNNLDLLEAALTHKSFYYPLKDDVDMMNDRLEFVGDSNLGCVVATELFLKYPNLDSGALTKLRAANVNTEKLARVAMEHGLYRFFRHKISILESQIKEFKEAIVEYPDHSYGLVDPPKVLANIVESLLGAVYIDSCCDLHTIRKVFLRLAEPLIDLRTLGNHPMAELNEFCQKHGMKLKYEDQWKEKSRMNVVIDGILAGSGTYKNRRDIAQNRAAKVALENLKKLDNGILSSNIIHITTESSDITDKQH